MPNRSAHACHCEMAIVGSGACRFRLVCAMAPQGQAHRPSREAAVDCQLQVNGSPCDLPSHATTLAGYIAEKQILAHVLPSACAMGCAACISTLPGRQRCSIAGVVVHNHRATSLDCKVLRRIARSSMRAREQSPCTPECHHDRRDAAPTEVAAKQRAGARMGRRRIARSTLGRVAFCRCDASAGPLGCLSASH